MPGALTHDAAAAGCRAYTNLAVLCLGQDASLSHEFCRAGSALAERIGNRLHQAWLQCVPAFECGPADEDSGVAAEAASTILAVDERMGYGNQAAASADRSVTAAAGLAPHGFLAAQGFLGAHGSDRWATAGTPG